MLPRLPHLSILFSSRRTGNSGLMVRQDVKLSILFSSRQPRYLTQRSWRSWTFNPLFIETYAAKRKAASSGAAGTFQSSFHRDQNIIVQDRNAATLNFQSSFHRDAGWENAKIEDVIKTFNPLFIETMLFVARCLDRFTNFQSSFHRDTQYIAINGIQI